MPTISERRTRSWRLAEPSARLSWLKCPESGMRQEDHVGIARMRSLLPAGIALQGAWYRVAQFLQEKFGEDRYRRRHRWATRVDEPQAEVGARTAIGGQNAYQFPLRDDRLDDQLRQQRNSQ